ncbi:ribbon-helix-helix domain-containing protein [Geminicoccaceae bacterium 1502E]|nr:ribbon-helix-helix domain-containing protein [Geminicoccaceae bacterium 1502E]
MCRVYAGTDPKEYEPVTRSVRLHGAVTSIRLEEHFWKVLDEMSRREGMPTPRFLCTLYDEVQELHGEVRNFASFLRVACTIFLEQGQMDAPDGEAARQAGTRPGAIRYA